MRHDALRSSPLTNSHFTVDCKGDTPRRDTLFSPQPLGKAININVPWLQLSCQLLKSPPPHSAMHADTGCCWGMLLQHVNAHSCMTHAQHNFVTTAHRATATQPYVKTFPKLAIRQLCRTRPAGPHKHIERLKQPALPPTEWSMGLLWDQPVLLNSTQPDTSKCCEWLGQSSPQRKAQ